MITESTTREDTPSGPARRPPAVGRQVRRWRGERGLTLAKVADATGLNVGYLSQIENDKASPSLSCLSSIASALDVPIAWFLVDESQAPEVTRASDRQWREQPGGRASHGAGVHSHPGDEHHYVTAGRFRLTQGGHVVELGPGDYLRWDGLIPHDAEAIGDETATMLIVRLTRHGQPHD
jgi:transcriptional regulator with XRE-family HTH domain